MTEILNSQYTHSTAFESDPLEAMLDGIKQAIAIRKVHGQSPPKALAMSRSTWLAIADGFVTYHGTYAHRLFGISIEFDEKVPLNQFRPIYD